MLPVLVLRPEPGNAATCRAARALGLEPWAAPLFRYVARAWRISPDASWQGLLIGSAAAVTYGGPELSALRSIPVHAVGPSTARVATERGFNLAATGSGGMQALVDGLRPGAYLRLSGDAKVPLQPPPGVTIDDVTVYSAQPQPLVPPMVAQLRSTRVLALLHSGEAARHFAEQCTRNNLARERIAIACLAPRIADAAGQGWRDIRIAPKTTDDAVLSLAQQMCQTL